MSDFDKEAEREKLRERFAEDEEKRETTEQMSELLLQGATMTNSHCDTCGNPLFRYDGQTFCAACQRAESGDTTDATATADDAPAAGEGAGAEGETAGDSQRIPVDDPRDGETTERDAKARSRETTATGRSEPTPADTRRAPPSRTRNDTTDSNADRHSTGDAGDLAATEASLARTLHRLASAAENSGDLGRAREHLAAAHEAAEALDAVRDARR